MTQEIEIDGDVQFEQLSPDEIDKDTQILLTFINYQWSQAQQSENQRATMTNFIIVITTLLQGFIVERQFDLTSIMVAILMIFLGIFGIIISVKYYERFRISTNRIGEMMKYLDNMHKSAKLRALQKIADKEHNQRFPKMSKVRLHRLWYAFHTSIIIFGITNVIIIIIVN
jgi:hypothetical protein